LDDFVWGISELHINKSPHNTTDSLVQTIKEVMDSLDRDTMERACKCFWSRIKTLVEADGNLF
jgi:hypothetical protein